MEVNISNRKVVYSNNGYMVIHGVVGYDIVDECGEIVCNILDRLDAIDKVSELSGLKNKIIRRVLNKRISSK